MQRALLSTELETIFANAPAAPNSLSRDRIQAAYAKAMGRTEEAAELESKAKKGDESKRRVPEEGDDCPICYDSMHHLDMKILTFCDECGNALHTECFQQCTPCRKFSCELAHQIHRGTDCETSHMRLVSCQVGGCAEHCQQQHWGRCWDQRRVSQPWHRSRCQPRARYQ